MSEWVEVHRVSRLLQGPKVLNTGLKQSCSTSQTLGCRFTLPKMAWYSRQGSPDPIVGHIRIMVPEPESPGGSGIQLCPRQLV